MARGVRVHAGTGRPLGCLSKIEFASVLISRLGSSPFYTHAVHMLAFAVSPQASTLEGAAVRNL